MTDVTMTPSSPEIMAFVASGMAEPAVSPPPPARSVRRGDAAIRGLEPRDIPAVCDLFAATFRPGRTVAREAVERSLAATYLTAPGDRARPASQVYVGAGGSVDGFMGIVTLEARFRGRRLRCGILGSFMGREDDRARAGLKLARATFALDLDLMFSDTANRGSVDLSRSFGFDVLPAHSLAWLKILRPCAMLAEKARRTVPRLGTSLAAFARGVDHLVGRLPHVAASPNDPGEPSVRPLAVAEIAPRARPLLDRHVLGPAWDDDELAWLLATAGRRLRDGPLLAREVLDRRGRVAGLFLLHVRPGGVARVLQVLADRGREPTVMSAVIREAARLGATAVQGRTSPAASAGLLWQRGIVYRNAPAAIGFGRDPEIHAALLSDAACLGGLFGETWTLPDELG